MKFTDRYIESLKPQSARYTIREDNAHGNGTLALRVSPNGAKSWSYIYRQDGRGRRMTLGRYPAMSVAQAHEAAGEAMAARERGLDPAGSAVASRAAARAAPTFKELAADYLERHARPNKRAGSVYQDEGMLKKDLLPAFGPHKAEAIQRADVRRLLAGIVDRGAPIQANRTLALLRKLYNWAMAEDLVSHNPCDRLPAPGRERRRDRVLSETELQALLTSLASAKMTEPVKLILRLQLLTAQRCGEVLRAQWSHIDLATGWWTIPAEKAKNHLTHRVPLSRQALAVLSEARALNPDRRSVFPSPRGDKPMVITAVGLAVRRNLDHFAAAGVGQFVPHDLRRTAASCMTGMSVSRLTVGKILNHAEPGVTAVYDRHSYDAEKRAALDGWGRKVAALEAAAARGLAVVEPAKEGRA